MRNVMILLILTVLLLIVGCIQQPQQVVVVEEKDYETFDDVDKNGEEYESYTMCIDSCDSCVESCEDRLFVELELCGNINSESLKQNCLDKVYFAEAIASGTLTKCEAIQDEFEQDSCKVSVTAQAAVEQNNIGYCDELDDLGKEECTNTYYTESAIAENDPNYCEALEGYDKEFCLEKFEVE
jgi:hypothetical protein